MRHRNYSWGSLARAAPTEQNRFEFPLIPPAQHMQQLATVMKFSLNPFDANISPVTTAGLKLCMKAMEAPNEEECIEVLSLQFGWEKLINLVEMLHDPTNSLK